MDSGEEELRTDVLFADQSVEHTDLEKEDENPISDFSRKIFENLKSMKFLTDI